MDPLVFLEVTLLTKGLSTLRTLMWLFSSMYHLVDFKFTATF